MRHEEAERKRHEEAERKRHQEAERKRLEEEELTAAIEQSRITYGTEAKRREEEMARSLSLPTQPAGQPRSLVAADDTQEPTSAETWSVDAVVRFFRRFSSLERYCATMMENEVTGAMLLELIESDSLSDLGIDVKLHQLKIKTEVKKWVHKGEEKSKYTKTRVLGKGSFGTTYLAQHAIKGAVALKVIEPQPSAPHPSSAPRCRN